MAIPVQPLGTAPVVVVVGHRQKKMGFRRIGQGVFLFGMLVLAICGLNGVFDHSEVDVNLLGKAVPTVTATPLTSSLKDVTPATVDNTHEASAVVTTKPSLAAAPAPISLAGMEREVLELEKQIQRHMSVRQDSLEKALTATAKCAPGDSACSDAHQQINWKLSQDKYEQAAMSDILKEDKSRSAGKKATNAEAAALFQHYAAKADQLSGLKSMSSLSAQTEQMAKLHTIAEHKSLDELKQAEQKLHTLKMAERKDLDDKRAAEEQTMISETAKHVQSELAKMNGDSTAEQTVSTGCGADCDQTDTSSAKYQSDFQQAKEIEAERRQAFLVAEKRLHAKVLAERQDRERTLESDERQHSHDSFASESGSSSPEAQSYSEDVQHALQMESKRTMALEAARKESAEEDISKTVAPEHQSSERPSEDAKFMQQAAEASSDTKYRDDVQRALRDSRKRESTEGSLIARARQEAAARDLKAQQKANAEAQREVSEAGSLSSADNIPKDYSDVSSQTYVSEEEAAKGRALAKAAAERAQRERFLHERSQTLKEHAQDAQSVIESRESEVSKILSP